MRQPSKIASAIGLALTLTQSNSLLAADISPQIGTWAIDAENNGKPGRGFQIDVQNDVLVLYFYGYEPSGESTYWLAAGRLPVGSNEITADLGEYQGGMALGDPIKNATYIGSRGPVTLRFQNGRKGEICLPGESCKAISAFNFGFEDNATELIGSWFVTSYYLASQYDMDAYPVEFSSAVAKSNPNSIDRAIGETNLELPDGRFVSAQVVCDKLTNPVPRHYQCQIQGGGVVQNLTFNVERNTIAGEFYDSQGVKVGNILGWRLKNASGRATSSP